MVSLAEYFDLVWCLHNDLWGTSVFLDNAYDVHLFIQIVSIWGVEKPRKIAGKNNGSEILVVCVKIEETYFSRVEGINNCPLNNYVLIVVVVSF